MRYTLIVFDRGVGYPEEFTILNPIFTDNEAVCAASCGPINICQFNSEHSKQDIYDRLKEKDLEFILTEEDGVLTNLPKKLQNHFSNSSLKPDDLKPEVNKRAKMSLKDQLESALAKEEYEVAAAIQKKIDELADPSPKVVDDKPSGTEGEDKE